MLSDRAWIKIRACQISKFTPSSSSEMELFLWDYKGCETICILWACLFQSPVRSKKSLYSGESTIFPTLLIPSYLTFSKSLKKWRRIKMFLPVNWKMSSSRCSNGIFYTSTLFHAIWKYHCSKLWVFLFSYLSFFLFKWYTRVKDVHTC